MFLSSRSLDLVGVYPGNKNVAAVFQFKSKVHICQQLVATTNNCDPEAEEVTTQKPMDEVIVYYDDSKEISLIPTQTKDGFSVVGTSFHFIVLFILCLLLAMRLLEDATQHYCILKTNFTAYNISCYITSDKKEIATTTALPMKHEGVKFKAFVALTSAMKGDKHTLYIVAMDDENAYHMLSCMYFDYAI
jgi:hypothetical protein